ncbi:MAG: hypothetical protein Q4G43_14285 [Mobilicoccus sp.]|nr:hypothetical protein [Mobilicoccus sp.]
MRRVLMGATATAVLVLGGCADGPEDAVGPNFHRQMETASVGDLVDDAASGISEAAGGTATTPTEPRDPEQLIDRIAGCRLVSPPDVDEEDTRAAACAFDNDAATQGTTVEVRTFIGRQPASVVPRSAPGRSVITGPDFVAVVDDPHTQDRPVDLQTITRQLDGTLVE